MTQHLHDAAARELIRTATGSTLFVEAGAGSGKTRCLVDRVSTLVLDDDIPLARIVAVTFTEKAGAELRDRLRATFETAQRLESGGVERQDRAGAALEDLDSAAIGTLHSFAQRILSAYPIEAGIPPLVEVLDEVASGVAFEERWTQLRARLLDDDELAEPLLVGMAAGVTLEHLRSLCRAFGADWDLIEDRVLIGRPAPVRMPDVQPLVAEATRLTDQAEHCRSEADRFLEPLLKLRAWGDRLSSAADSHQQLEVLVDASRLRWGYGQRGNWPDLQQLKDGCKAVQENAAAVVAEVMEATLRNLAHRIAAEVLSAAAERQADGRLEFHDLLVLARNLLRRDRQVRADLQDRYPRLLLDEFQDTDPIQIELAVRIAGGADASADRWEDVVVPPGSLFVVGDPKQSIYRFRRADIGNYLRAQDRIGETVALTTNFRTTAPVLDWVNAVFGRLIQAEPDMQPAYQALDGDRVAARTGPAVVLLGAQTHPGKPNAQALRVAEAADVAATIRQALTDEWSVEDPRTHQMRPARLGDIAILVPARTSLPFLEEALDRAGVPYRAEASSLVYQAAEVRDLLATARAVADPSDGLSLVAALRSPLFGCGDDDLWTWKQSGGSFHILAPVDDALSTHPVADAMRYLSGLHRRCRWMTPSEVLGAVVEDRRMLEVAAMRGVAFGPHTRDAWRRLRFVVDQARAWSEVEHGGLRSYLLWAARQGDEASRVAEAVLPETDTDTVRVMTVHAAKGLEFPMVVLSGMSSAPRRSGGVQVLWPAAGGYAVRLTKSVQTNDFEVVAPVDEQMDEQERRRLLYVAATRARDHLVVSLHRSDRAVPTNARLLAEAGANSPETGAVEFGGAAILPAASRPDRLPRLPANWSAALGALESARATTRLPSSLSASGLEGSEPAVALNSASDPGLAKGGRDVELPAWSKGRYGSAIGRAVHGVLQTVDLESGAGLDDAVAAQCVAEGVTGHAEIVAELARAALSSTVVGRAARRPHWRESYVGTSQAGGPLLEGFVDLMYREDDGSIVVVDYKTDAIPSGAVESRVAYYRPQVHAYNVMLRGCGLVITRTVLLFLAPDRALEYDLVDLDSDGAPITAIA